jgi:DNA-binding GntR family transcriptional regulator
MENIFENVLPAASPMSKEDFAYLMLREAILSGQLKAGETLVQTQIADSLGVSPIPIRAAVRRLTSEGLITQEPHHPPKVSTLSTDGLEEILLVRMHLETLAIREAIPHITSDSDLLSEVKELMGSMEQALRDEDMPAFGALNKRFHLTLYEACPYPLLKQMIRDLWDNSDRSRSRMVFGLVPGLAAQSQEEHRHLLEMIEDGDAEGAAELMEVHKNRSRKLFFQYLREEA